MIRRAMVVFGLLGLLVGTFAPVAYAQANSFTETFHEVTETFPDFNPCTGDPGELTVTYNGVFHITEDPNGGLHATGTQTGTFEFEPDDPNAESVVGQFTIWVGFNSTQNNNGFWVTFKVRGEGSEGSTFVFNAVEQFHFSNGELQVEFSFDRCH